MEDARNPDLDRLTQHLHEVQRLLSRRRLVESLVNRQEMPRHGLVENIVHKQHLSDLRKLLERFDVFDIARILEALSPEDRLLTWEHVPDDRLDAILALLLDDVREELVSASRHQTGKTSLSDLELQDGKLTQLRVAKRADFAHIKPIWIDLVASARFHVEDNGEIHLHSDFLLDAEMEPRNVAVAFILCRDILFSVRKEELPAFRLQRLRARTQPGYVAEGRDVLLDLFAADAEYSAGALEDVYSEFETVGRRVLNPRITDDEAARILSEIARGEDLNGRIRKNVLDTRRGVSFLMRGKFLSTGQQDDARQILRDIESLDGHTSFLFGKINFLMDATIGFISINKNKRVSKLTTISVVFVPTSILASMGGMSEYSMMTQGVDWPIAYGAFALGSALVGWMTYPGLRHFERRRARASTAAPA